MTDHNVRGHKYDYLAKDSHQLRLSIALELIREHLLCFRSVSSAPRPRVLSLGCADGRFEERIQALGAVVHGVDGNEAALVEAKKRGILVTRGDLAQPLPHAEGTFDVVFAGEIIEHIYDTRAFLAEIHRVLARGGALVLTTPNLARLADRIRFMFGKSPRHINPFHEELSMHIRPFTADALTECLRISSLEVVSLRSTFVSLDPFLNLKLRSRALARLFPSLGKILIAKAIRRDLPARA